MPTVPIAQNTVGLASVTDAKLQPADYGAAGEMIGRSMQGLGAAGADYAEVQQKIADIHDDAATKDAVNAVANFHAEHGYTGPDAYFQKGGKDALLARPEYEQSLDQQIATQRAALKTPRQQLMYDRAVKPQRVAWGIAIAEHADKETTTYDTQESDGRRQTAATLAAASYLQPDEAEKQIATGVTETQHLGVLNHWGPDKTAAEALRYTSAVRQDIALRYVYSGDPNGPEAARRYVEQHRGDFTADSAAAVETHARTQTNAIAAEQRRIDAEARRQANEEARAAGERAADTERLIGQGVPVPATVVAQAITDARQAKRPGLEASIRTGAFKNNLTVQYQDHTPSEIQDRLNVLGPKIKAAGDNPNPNDVIEFEHLTGLRDKSEGALRSDPVSWGAAHLGLNVPPINWADPASVSARVRAATTISQRTGAPMRPLTAPEAASLAPTAATGSVDQRRGLISQLAMLGPSAASAAEQVAPNDHVFQGLVGLATSSNRAVATGYVGQALAGTEVLKRNPGVIDHAQAQTRFNNYAGGAFRLLPTVADGVFNNAKNINAAWADQHGHTDWKHDTAIGDQFEGSVDAALGAYNQNGVKYGGLGMWKGQRIVLPDGMSQQQLETRIMRADQPALMKGSNGVPVWGDGHPLKVGEVKGLQLVAVGDGIYRLTDGHSYVAKKGGGFYELNIHAVPQR